MSLRVEDVIGRRLWDLFPDLIVAGLRFFGLPSRSFGLREGLLCTLGLELGGFQCCFETLFLFLHVVERILGPQSLLLRIIERSVGESLLC